VGVSGVSRFLGARDWQRSGRARQTRRWTPHRLTQPRPGRAGNGSARFRFERRRPVDQTYSHRRLIGSTGDYPIPASQARTLLPAACRTSLSGRSRFSPRTATRTLPSQGGTTNSNGSSRSHSSPSTFQNGRETVEIRDGPSGSSSVPPVSSFGGSPPSVRGTSHWRVCRRCRSATKPTPTNNPISRPVTIPHSEPTSNQPPTVPRIGGARARRVSR
jgi:hypothetical protein